MGVVAASGGGGNSPTEVTAFGLDERPRNVTCVAPARPGTTSTLALARAFPNLSFSLPVAMMQAPGAANHWYVVEKTGTVRRFAADDAANASSLVVDLTDRVDAGPNEAGLLGMAFHPEFGANGYVYLSYTGQAGGLRSYVSRFTSADGGASLDPDSEVVILSIDQPYGNHNGGHIAFGPDGYLYLGLGDGGSGGDPDGNGQNTHTLLGAMLRIDIDVSAEDWAAGMRYYIPPDNPFAASTGCGNGGGCPEIYAWGFRNPWRWSFDRDTGELWLGDVGQNQWEEVDRVERGGNYGWNIREGAHCYDAGSCASAGLIEPVAEYDHSVGRSITGGYVYRGGAIAALHGTYLYADFSSGRIWGLAQGGQGLGLPRQLLDTSHSIAAFAEANDGELYLLDYGPGHVHRLVQDAGGGIDDFPRQLSETGCVDPATPSQPAPGMIPYAINAPFWSDGADKERFLALPDGAHVGVANDGDWSFPIGTVLMKHFRLGGELVETRLFVRHDDGDWAGYSYEWNDAQTDAVLVEGGRAKDINGQTWTYPSADECLQCHTAAAGRSLGLETAQLNTDFTYPSTGRSANQLATLQHIGIFDESGAGLANPDTVPMLAAPFGAGDREQRARAYLHSNCAQCHRPTGGTASSMDLRYATTLAATNTCDVFPEGLDLGINLARLIAPGEPGRSLLAARTARRDGYAMPPLGSHLVDDLGVALIEEWIQELTTCP
ncbi:MAG: hypothetical protein AMJ69_06375 [Gammaproteobacteria bacterium SG8_47]|nr:MAG: hypothetical protein AMJ69_06375 [Gammaproteobacteria bacterium SG8_47]